jgi:hypothetical protein
MMIGPDRYRFSWAVGSMVYPCSMVGMFWIEMGMSLAAILLGIVGPSAIIILDVFDGIRTRSVHGQPLFIHNGRYFSQWAKCAMYWLLA